MKIINKTIEDKKSLMNSRIVAIDYGLKRVGLAVCDELHITASPLATIDSSSTNFWNILIDNINREKASAIVVGYPFRSDGKRTDFMEDLDNFIDKLEDKTDLKIFLHDESNSSKKAVDQMIEIGMKKSKRKKKGSIDRFAAAIILREFLEDIRIKE